ncbi:putative baseplate assembly protein [Streptomyces sp. NPDC093223]|uniref:putative baseplate assembly protein n=1 Tax=Streptomyces sp. NPDC093223 TaxID=3366033 RepID=UPI0037FB37CF
MLPTPELDDRDFEGLVEDAKRLIRQRCPEWSDDSPSDPGITLVEAFAYMMDQMITRLNHVPDRLYAKFLDLIGLRMLPPVAARTDITFWATTPVTGAPLTIHEGTTVATMRTDGDALITFRTDDDVSMVATELVAVLTRAAGDGGDRVHEYQPEQGLSAPFGAFTRVPQPQDELVLGLRQPARSCAVRIEFDGRVDGVGVVPQSPPLGWEAWTADGWVPCDVSDDTTGGLNRSGHMVVHVPPGHTASVRSGVAAAWLRVRILPTDGLAPAYASSPVVHGLGVATVGATVPGTHAEVLEAEVIGEAEGVPGQRMTLPYRPVLLSYGEPVLETADSAQAQEWKVWKRVEEFASSGPDDRHFALDAVAGEILFGPAVREPDGTMRRYGATPRPGALVRIRDLALGGGGIGNVPAGALRSLTSSIPFVAAVENRGPARGGADGETLAEALARGPLMLRSSRRAVTAEDFETLTMAAAPELARVRCLPAADVPSGVRVLVVPTAAGGRGLRLHHLIPAEETLKRVARQLDSTRLVGTSVMVEPPLYRGVTVVARVTALGHSDMEEVRAAVEDALHGYLNPLPGGGPNAQGWPFGRSVLVGEVFALVQRVPGVDVVSDVRLFAANPVTGERGQETAQIDLAPNNLVISYDHQVKVEARP